MPSSKFSLTAFLNEKFGGAPKQAPPAKVENDSLAVGLKYRYETETAMIFNHQLTTYLPQRPAKLHLFFVQGEELNHATQNGQQLLMRYFLEECDMKVSCFDESLFQDENLMQITLILKKAYEDLRERYEEDQFSFFAHSLAASPTVKCFSSLARQKSIPAPQKLILLSPWIDLSLSDPRMEALQELASDQNRFELKRLVEFYTAPFQPTDPQFELLDKNWETVNELFVITGTDDLLYPDTLKVKEKIRASEKATLKAEIVAGQTHDFLLYDVYTQHKYLRKIHRFLKHG